jgi:phosphatidylinositol glycan class M
LYHVGRLDHRHNFSPYFYPIYQSMFGSGVIDSGSQNLLSRLYRAADHPLFAFLPQMVATGAAGLILANKTTLEFAFFVQTVLFVTFNKVCTSQASHISTPCNLGRLTRFGL